MFAVFIIEHEIRVRYAVVELRHLRSIIRSSHTRTNRQYTQSRHSAKRARAASRRRYPHPRREPIHNRHHLAVRSLARHRCPRRTHTRTSAHASLALSRRTSARRPRRDNHERTWSELASFAGADAPAAVSRARTAARGLADAARRCVERHAIGAAMEDVDAIIASAAARREVSRAFDIVVDCALIRVDKTWITYHYTLHSM